MHSAHECSRLVSALSAQCFRVSRWLSAQCILSAPTACSVSQQFQFPGMCNAYLSGRHTRTVRMNVSSSSVRSFARFGGSARNILQVRLARSGVRRPSAPSDIDGRRLGGLRPHCAHHPASLRYGSPIMISSDHGQLRPVLGSHLFLPPLRESSAGDRCTGRTIRSIIGTLLIAKS